MVITNWWVSLLAPVSRSICKHKNNQVLGFDDSSSGGRLNRLLIKKIQKGCDIQPSIPTF